MCYVVAVRSDELIISIVRLEKHVMAICNLSDDTSPKPEVRYIDVSRWEELVSASDLSRICSLSSSPFARLTASCLAAAT